MFLGTAPMVLSSEAQVVYASRSYALTYLMEMLFSEVSFKAVKMSSKFNGEGFYFWTFLILQKMGGWRPIVLTWQNFKGLPLAESFHLFEVNIANSSLSWEPNKWYMLLLVSRIFISTIAIHKIHR